MTEPIMPPHDISVEQAALGAALIEYQALLELRAAGITEEEFYLGKHKIILRGLYAVHESQEQVDLISLGAWLNARPAHGGGTLLDYIGGTLYLTTIMSNCPTTAALPHYITTLRDLTLRRSYLTKLQKIAPASLQQDVEMKTTLDTLGQTTDSLFQYAVGEQIPGDWKADNETHAIVERVEAATGAGAVGIPLPYRNLEFVAPLLPGQLIVIAARPGMGKTMLAQNIELAVGKRGTKVMFVSLEMSREELALRTLAMETGIPLTTLKQASDPEVISAMMAATERHNGLPIFVTDPPHMSVDELHAYARLHQRRKGLDLLIVDYLQLLDPPRGKENRTQEVSAISRGLKQLARSLGIPVIVLSQLSRECERSSPRRPNLSHLRESGTIEQDADIVMLLYRPGAYGEDELKRVGYGEADIQLTEAIVAKQRDGQCFTGKLRFRGDISRFEDWVTW